MKTKNTASKRLAPAHMTTYAAATRNDHDHEYDAFRERIQSRFTTRLDAGGGHLFETDVTDLFEVYLGGLPAVDHQYHRCTCCRRFFDSYGGLVTIDDEGRTTPAFWNAEDAPPYYKKAIQAVAKAVSKAKVTGIFKSYDAKWGHPKTGVWTHYYAQQPKVERKTLLTAGQWTAELSEDYKVLSRAFGDFKPEVVNQALEILQADALYRQEKVLGPIQWFADLITKRASTPNDLRANLVWKAVAGAPAGWTHLRNTVGGSLLEDLANGLEFSEVSRKFAAKLKPTQYQRPQAPPAAGNIAQAEKTVEQLGIRNSLRRRFALLEEIETIWRPAASTPSKPGGVFDHLLREQSTASLILPLKSITWRKFAEDILPTASRIEFWNSNQRSNYGAFLTAADPDAPNILQWGNTFSQYVYTGGSTPGQWNLPANSWTKVNAISLLPHLWGGSTMNHQGRGAIIVLDGCRDTRQAGLALFPEILKGELREIRSTIEAYSNKGEIEGRESASVCGFVIRDSPGCGAKLLVTSPSGVKSQFIIDRWD